MARAKRIPADRATLAKFATPIEIPPAKYADYYAAIVTLPVAVLSVIVLVLSFVGVFAPLALLACYGAMLPRPVTHVSRGSGFQLFGIVVLTLSSPLIGLQLLWVWGMRLYRAAVCLPLCLCLNPKVCAARSALRPYQDAPGYRGKDGSKLRTHLDGVPPWAGHAPRMSHHGHPPPIPRTFSAARLALAA